ncbi:MAG: class I SAM-dependent methyltransferase [Bacteroidales bacterium]|nr:class I SAM-dependent methyltransferase [Bacteroidales bacterium]
MGNSLDNFSDTYRDNKNIYYHDVEIIHNWYERRILELAGNELSVLDLGIGRGTSTLTFSREFKHFMVIEGSKKIINDFRTKNPESNAEIVHAFFEDFNTDKRFDVIIMGFILEHVKDPHFILRRYSSFLKDEGKVLVSLPNAEALNRRLGFFAGLLPDITCLSENDLALGHQHYFTVNTLEELVTKAGFTVMLKEGIYLKPFTTSQMLSLNLSPDIKIALCKVGTSYPELSAAMLFQLCKK